MATGKYMAMDCTGLIIICYLYSALKSCKGYRGTGWHPYSTTGGFCGSRIFTARMLLLMLTSIQTRVKKMSSEQCYLHRLCTVTATIIIKNNHRNYKLTWWPDMHSLHKDYLGVLKNTPLLKRRMIHRKTNISEWLKHAATWYQGSHDQS